MSNTPAKPDNLFGICHALGETLGFNPLYLRLAFAGAFILDYKLTLLAYFACGVAVLAGALFSRPWRQDKADT